MSSLNSQVDVVCRTDSRGPNMQWVLIFDAQKITAWLYIFTLHFIDSRDQNKRVVLNKHVGEKFCSFFIGEKCMLIGRFQI